MRAAAVCALRVALAALAGTTGCAQLSPPALPILSPTAAAPARVVMLTVAGLTPAAYLPAAGAPAAMPTLAAMAEAGAAAEYVRAVAPAARYPVHATLVTGRLPARHGVTTDRLPGDRGSVERRPTPRPPLRSPALWEVVADSGRRAVALGWPGSSGGRFDLAFPESFSLAPGEPWTDWIEAHASPGLLGAARRLGAADPAVGASGPERDRLLAGLACEILGSKTPPALLLLHLSQTELPLAIAGPGSPDAQAAFAAVDVEIGRVLDCLRKAGFADSTAVLVAGDHGVAAVSRSISPNVALQEKGLIVPAVDGAGIQTWHALSRSNGSSAFVYARSERDAQLARRALAAVSARTQAFRIVSARELLERGADPEAWFGLAAEGGYVIDDAAAGPLVRPAPIRGSWGHVTEAPGTAPGFVAWGRGVRGGVRIARMDQADVAPTAAVLLGFELGVLDGQPVAGALWLPPVASSPAEESPDAR